MNPDILAAVAAYIQDAMGQSLLSSTGFPQVYSDYAPQQNPDGSPVAQPYCVVQDGPESYMAQSDDPGTGFFLSNIADGVLFAGFHATTKEQARALGRTAVRLVSDTRVQLDAQDGRVIALLPMRAETVSYTEPGVQEPTSFIRVVTINYKQQFLE